jgi:hypothetical protein
MWIAYFCLRPGTSGRLLSTLNDPLRVSVSRTVVHGVGQMCLKCWYRMKSRLQYARNFVFGRAVIQEANSRIHSICCYSFLNV